MLQKDYLMRMTQQLAAVLTTILFHKEKKEYAEAETEIEAAAKSLVGIDLKIIQILSVDDMIKLIKSSDIYAGRCLVTAELLKEYADVLGDKGKSKESLNIYLKSLWLYIETMLTRELPTPEDYYPRINFLIKNLSSLEFSSNLKVKIFEYYEFSGQFSKAEDILFEILDSDSDGNKNLALNFYERLRLKTEEELISGNLSHEEVEESFEEINSRFQ